jgi:hypothetical protein
MPAILVDQRETERRELSQAALVTVVGTSGQVLQGEIRNVSEGGTQIQLSEPLPPFTLVRIEYEDNLLLGEVVYCRQDQSAWLLGLRVEHGLFGLTALAASMQGF